ncbi:MAG: hypothetical protein QNJ44_00265 [Rhodobacter sp.]|nr:hypothetical protein [Rhodobacter sp.]
MNLYALLQMTVLDFSDGALQSRTMPNEANLELLNAQVENHTFLLSAAAAPLAGLVLSARSVSEADQVPLIVFFLLSAGFAFLSVTIRFLIVAALKLKKTIILAAIADNSDVEVDGFPVKKSWHEISILFSYFGFVFFAFFLIFIAIT